MFKLRSATTADINALSDLCKRSKAAWGYDASFMAHCVAALTITRDDVLGGCMRVAYDGDDILGVVQISCAGEQAEIAKLFVEPRTMHRGVGRKLFDWAIHEARRRGTLWLLIDSDPHAVDFYRRMGAVDDGDVPSESIPGRMLPRLRLRLGGSQDQTAGRGSP